MSGADGSERQSRRSREPVSALLMRGLSGSQWWKLPNPFAFRPAGTTHLGSCSRRAPTALDRVSVTGLVMVLVLVPLLNLGCRTDQAAQDGINQMRAEQIAIEDRYAALRNEYEKLRNRLAAQGDPAAQSPTNPSALPLTYPPGPSPLDDAANTNPPWNWPTEDLLQLPDNPALAPGLNPGSNPAANPQPAQPPTGSVLQSDPSAPPAKPTRVELDPSQTRVIRGGDGQQVTLRMVARTSDESGRAANPTGTYSLRLLAMTPDGANRVVGDWNFPAESIRRFVAANGGGQGRAAQAGVPLEVSFVDTSGRATRWMAELEYFPTQGQKLRSQQWVGENVADAPSLQSWVDQLPLPRDGRGLMTTGTAAAPTGTAVAPAHTGGNTTGPTWSPQRN